MQEIQIRALIFDFDGLLLDTEWPEVLSWQEIFHAHGCDFPYALWEEAIGTITDLDPYKVLADQLGAPIDREAVRRARYARFAELMAEQSPLPGVTDYLAEAQRRNLKLAVASSSSRGWVVGNLEQHGLVDYFHCIKCSDDVTAVKPDPALYLEALAALGVRPQEAIAFEDSLNGARAAKAAGLFCVAVPNRLMQRHSFDLADLRLESLAAMPLAEVLQRAAQRANGSGG